LRGKDPLENERLMHQTPWKYSTRTHGETPMLPSYGVEFQQPHCRAQRLFEQRRRDRNILQLDNFNAGDLQRNLLCKLFFAHSFQR
jgi:hypothetical protein